MAEFLDNAGRSVEIAISELGNVIKNGMESAVKVTEKFAERDDKRNSTLEDIKGLMNQLNQLTTDVGDIKNIVQQSIQMHTTRQSGGPSSDIPKDKPSLQELASTVIDVGSGSGGADQPATEKFSDVIIGTYGKDLEEWLKNPTVTVDSMPESRTTRLVGDEGGFAPPKIPFGAGGVPPVPPSDGGKGGGGKADGKGGLTQTGQKQVMRSIARMTTGLMGVLTAITGGIAVSNIFEGVIKEELDYHKIMSRIALQSHGLSDTSATWRDNFRSAGNRLDTVLQTGQKIGKWMQGMVKLQQRGLKNQKFNNKLIKSALNMSIMTGIEAETASEMYADWAQHFGMGNFELATMNVAMKDIVRQTGLTGKNLETAVKTAEGLQRKMKAAGVATREMLESSIRISAIAQKAGIGDVATAYTDALSGGFAKFAELPNNIKGALMRFGQGDSKLMEDIMAGRGMQEKNLRKIAEGMKMDTRSILGIDLMTADLTKMDSTRMKSLQIMAEKVYGMGIGDLQKMVKTMHKGSRTIAERSADATKKSEQDIAALDKQRARGLITEEQHTKMIADRNAQLTTQLKDFEMTDISKTLNAILGTAAKKGGVEFNKALLDAGGGDMATGIEKVQLGFATAAQDVEARMKAAVEAGTMQQSAFNQAMKGFDPTAMTKELELAMAAGDTTKVAELQQKLVNMQQTADAQGMKSTNVVDKIENHVSQINAMLRDALGSNLIAILEAMGAVAVIVTMIGASIVTAIAGLGIVMTTMLGGRFTANLLKIFKSPFKSLKSVRGGSKFARGGKIGGIMVKGAPSSATRAAEMGKAGKHFEAAGKEFSKATKGMKESVGKFGKAVKGTKVWTAASNKIDNAAKGLSRAAGAAKTRLASTGARIAQGAGRAKGALRAGGKRVLGAADTVAKRGVGAARALKATKVGKGIIGAGRALHGVGKAGMLAARGTLTAIKATTSWTVIIPVAISAIEGFAGAMMAGAKANEIFNVSQDKVTERMRMAAEGAGIFTGILDGLTFGLFGKWLGPTGTLTIALSKLMHTFWPLAAALQVVLLPFKILWGILKGLYLFLKNAFIGLWEGIKIAVEPVVEIFDELWNVFAALGKAFAPILELFGFTAEAGAGLPSVVDMISGAFGMLGTALGAVFKVLGYVTWVLKPVVWGLKLLVGAINMIVGSVSATVKGIIDWFKKLWYMLVGGSLIPDLIMGIFKWFLKLPILIFKAIWGIPKMIIEALWSVGKSIGKIFVKLPKIIWNGIKKVWKKIKGLGKLIWDTIKELPEIIWDAVKGMGSMIWNSVKSLGGKIWGMISKFPALLAGIMAKIPGMILKATTAVPKAIAKGLLSIPKWIAGKLSSIFSWLGLEGIADYFGAIGDGFGGLIDIVEGIFTLDFGKVWDGIKGLGGAIWDAISSIPGYFYDVFLGIPGMFLNAVWTGLKWVGDAIWGAATKLWSLVKKIPGLIWDGIKGIGGALLGGLEAVFVTFPTWLFDTIVGGLANLGTWIWDHTIGAMINMIPSWIRKMFGGGG